jgi:hypothetical protein
VTGRDRAYASWTPKPVQLSATESAAAVNTCLAAHDLSGKRAAQPLIADRRGDWAYVLIPLPSGIEASCIMPTEAIGVGKVLRDGQWFGGSGDAGAPKTSPRHISQSISGVGSTDEGLLRYMEGVAGRDVIGLTITTPRGVKVVASVANGRYAAWWPAGEDKITSPEISGASTLELTLRDGTTSREPQ